MSNAVETVLDPGNLKEYLFKLGHFRNPAMPTGIVDKSQLEGISLTSDEMATAIRSLQDFRSNDLDVISHDIHGRISQADGEIGPATERLIQMPRCGEPDYPDDVELATGRGSWPSGCLAEYPNNHTFVIHWDRSGMPSYLDPVIDECIARCYAAYRDIGIVFITTSSRTKCNTNVTWQRGQGWIGLAIVGQSQTCNKRIWAKFDNRYRPGQLIDQWSRLLAHEFGHNMGLRHSRGGIMNPSITSGRFTNTAWRGDPSFSTLKRWFGGEPVPKPDDPDDPDPPKPAPPANGVVLRGSLQVEIDGKIAGEFIPVPKTKV